MSTCSLKFSMILVGWGGLGTVAKVYWLMAESASYLLAVSQSDLVCPITNVIEQLKLDSN